MKGGPSCTEKKSQSSEDGKGCWIVMNRSGEKQNRVGIVTIVSNKV